MSTRPDDVLDAVPHAEVLAAEVEAHLDRSPLPVDEAEVDRVVARLHRRMKPRPRRSWVWAAVALAAGGLVALRWTGSVESPEVTVVDPGATLLAAGSQAAPTPTVELGGADPLPPTARPEAPQVPAAPTDEELVQKLLEVPDPGPYVHDDRLPHASVRFHAVDPEGRPVGSAIVRFRAGYDDAHVNLLTGESVDLWVLYLPDRSERFLQQGQSYPVEIIAPGYGYLREDVRVEKRRKNDVVVRMTPWSPPEIVAPSGIAERALDAYQGWLAAEAQLRVTPDRATTDRVHAARQEAAVRARRWMDADGGETAHQMCLLTGSLPLCGE